MTLEEKFSVLESYRKLKDVLLCLQVERDELRDLKRLSSDMGLPPKGGTIGDPTGNSAAMLVESIDEVDSLIWDVQSRMREVKSFINDSPSISQRDKLVLLLKYIRGANNGFIAQEMGLPSRSAVQKRVKRIVERM